MGNRTNMINLISMIIIWVASSFGFYLLLFQMKYIKGHIHQNNLSSGISEVLGSIFAGILMANFSIKRSLIVSFLFSLFGMLGLLFYSTTN